MFTETNNLRPHKFEKKPNIFLFLHYYFILALEKKPHPLIYTTWHLDALGFVSVTHCNTKQSTLHKYYLMLSKEKAI